MSGNWLLVGAGYSARRFARQTGRRLAGTTRDPERMAMLEASNIAPLLFDGDTLSAQLSEALRSSTHILVSAAPGEGGDPFLRSLERPLREAAPELTWIGYLSTVGVYGDHDGAWIDEEAELRPRPGRSGQRLVAEEAWRAAGEAAGIPTAILRLSGIYGPGRNAFVNLQRGTARRIIKPGQIFNRIHVDDIAGAIEHLSAGRLGGIFNVTDDEPSPPQDVVEYAAHLMGVEPPPEIPFDQAEMTPMARSFYGETKRVSNAKLKATGYGFIYPDYRAALDAMWQAGTWRG